MNFKYIWIVLAIIVGSTKLFAQSPAIAALKPGDKVPDMEFDIIHPLKQKIKLSDFRGKVVILDFWTVSCTPCIEKLPHLESILKANGDIVQIIAVNADGAARTDMVNAFFKRFARFNGAELGIPVALNSDKISAYFPFKIVPHIVWIDKTGVLRAITSGKEINEKLIRDVYDEKKVDFKLKQDYITFNMDQPLFKEGNGGQERSLKFKSMITGYLEGVNQGQNMPLIDEQALLDRYCLTNNTISQLYKRAYNINLDNNRLILSSRHPEKFADFFGNKYILEHTFCYEIIGPGVNKSQILKRMRQDLASYFGLKGVLKKMEMPCLVVRRKQLASDNELPKKKDVSEKEKEMTVDHIVYRMNNYFEKPVINEVKQADVSVPMKMNSDGSSFSWNLNELRGILSKAGLEIRQEKREMEVFVLLDVE